MVDSRTYRLIVGSRSVTVYEDVSDVHSLGKSLSSSLLWYVNDNSTRLEVQPADIIGRSSRLSTLDHTTRNTNSRSSKH